MAQTHFSKHLNNLISSAPTSNQIPQSAKRVSFRNYPNLDTLPNRPETEPQGSNAFHTSHQAEFLESLFTHAIETSEKYKIDINRAISLLLSAHLSHKDRTFKKKYVKGIAKEIKDFINVYE